uniref:GBF-interacting protein 1 N-terminal domain-containing protein n=1 Tax=Rhizophora mucronata TaxID=61149 RepID=A0A2P2LZ21_RHIMU
MSGGGSKLSISSDTRTIIQTLKEIKNSHSEEEIYAILEECSMDPDEAAQKLLSQGKQPPLCPRGGAFLNLDHLFSRCRYC